METIQAEVESLLSQLGNINEEMAGLAAGAGAGGGGAAIHHTLQRHAEILQVSTVAFNSGLRHGIILTKLWLQDYRQEFSKTSANIASMMEREELLSSVSSDISHYRGKEQGRNQKMDSLQRELEHTRSARNFIILTKTH